MLPFTIDQFLGIFAQYNQAIWPMHIVAYILFTFGLLLWANARVPKTLLIIPFLWSVIGFGAALSLGIREDIGLLVASVLSVGLLLWRDRTSLHTSKRERYA